MLLSWLTVPNGRWCGGRICPLSFSSPPPCQNAVLENFFQSARFSLSLSLFSLSPLSWTPSSSSSFNHARIAINLLPLSCSNWELPARGVISIINVPVLEPVFMYLFADQSAIIGKEWSIDFDQLWLVKLKFVLQTGYIVVYTRCTSAYVQSQIQTLVLNRHSISWNVSKLLYMCIYNTNKNAQFTVQYKNSSDLLLYCTVP